MLLNTDCCKEICDMKQLSSAHFEILRKNNGKNTNAEISQINGAALNLAQICVFMYDLIIHTERLIEKHVLGPLLKMLCSVGKLLTVTHVTFAFSGTLGLCVNVGF